MNQLLVLFDSDVDDAIIDQDEQSTAPAGKGIAETIAASLKECGYTISPVSQRDDYGWEFEIQQDQARFLAVVQMSDTWMVVIGEITSLIQKLLGRKSADITPIAEATRDAIITANLGANVRIETP